MEFSELIRTKRTEKAASAKEFHRNAKLSCSYFYYSKVESGTVPELPLAIEILRALGVNLRKGLYAWVRSQMPDKETKAFFAELDDETPLSAEQHSTSRAIVVNRMQAKLLESDPIYWEILVFFSTYHTFGIPEDKAIAKCFGVAPTKFRKHLETLYDHGLLDKQNGKYISKEWFFIPYEQEFNSLRDVNFRRALDQFWHQSEDERFRTTITKPLTPAQWKEVEAKVVALTHSVVDMKEVTPPESAPYTIGVFASRRRFGNG